MGSRGGSIGGMTVALAALALPALVAYSPLAGASSSRLRLATTTSTENSGLLAAILPAFEKLCTCKVQVIALGSGQAMAVAKRGDADVVLAHAKPLEEEFVASGHGLERKRVMYNDFVLVGPPEDPVRVNGARTAAEAFSRIAQGRANFFSRGDSSGTHVKEKEIWKAAGVEPGENWYMEVGRGMGETLMMASEKRGYTLADRGTFLAFREKVLLAVLLEGDPMLRNDYCVIAVNPELHPGVNYACAKRFIEWMTSPAGQKLVGDFGKEKFGLPLFHPAATPAPSP